MKKIRAGELRISDVVINIGTVEKLKRDGRMTRVTYTDGTRRSYNERARLNVQQISDRIEEADD